ncbi:hypothetical protein ACIQVO_37245 [Streptomyces sp. NPDC101062]|uniref:hypothetical protein n=1 Tax=unclassified Streptomyces TaxID=2593676 RepID=UPI002E7770A1|nr:hypothetical protein [Streptomyces sp. JV176]MEE1798120.1 hypothetical protein [Streptomyces sp. JV176]
MNGGIPARPAPYEMREATKADRPQIEELLDQRSKWTVRQRVPFAAVPFRLLQMIGQHHDPDGARVMVLAEDGHLLGCVVMTPSAPVTEGWSPREMSEPALYLNHACTRPDETSSRGTASSLMALWAGDQAARHGITLIRCSVQSGHVAGMLCRNRRWTPLRLGMSGAYAPVTLLQRRAELQPELDRFIIGALTLNPANGRPSGAVHSTP